MVFSAARARPATAGVYLARKPASCEAPPLVPWPLVVRVGTGRLWPRRRFDQHQPAFDRPLRHVHAAPPPRTRRSQRADSASRAGMPSARVCPIHERFDAEIAAAIRSAFATM